tara:strand:- start:503 stop:919 length:417 start_codon:yes stop_codon:yes gene_type:complete
MGLDCYIKHANEDKLFKSKRLENLGLCGAMFSGHGNGSFRGKVYEDFITWLMELNDPDCVGHTWHIEPGEHIQSDTLQLYGKLIQDYLEVLREENPSLQADDVVLEAEFDGYYIRELEDLALLFEIAAENKCIMETWW